MVFGFYTRRSRAHGAADVTGWRFFRRSTDSRPRSDAKLSKKSDHAQRTTSRRSLDHRHHGGTPSFRTGPRPCYELLNCIVGFSPKSRLSFWPCHSIRLSEVFIYQFHPLSFHFDPTYPSNYPSFLSTLVTFSTFHFLLRTSRLSKKLWWNVHSLCNCTHSDIYIYMYFRCNTYIATIYSIR